MIKDFSRIKILRILSSAPRDLCPALSGSLWDVSNVKPFVVVLVSGSETLIQ